MKTRFPFGQLLAAMLFGALISALPHLLAWLHTGSGIWVADADELDLYLSTASQAFSHHPFSLSDPIFAEARPSVYPWLQLGPGILLAKALGFAPATIGVFWRLLGGASIGAGWFLLFRDFFGKRPWTACALSVFLLAEPALLEGKPFFRQLLLALQLAAGGGAERFAANPTLHPEWRVITPALSLVFLQLYVLALLRARAARFSWPRVILAGAALGLLVHVYFYYWTGAALGLALAWLADRPARRTYLHAAWIGALIGAPKLVFDLQMKGGPLSDWLMRSDKFVEIGHFSEFIVPKAGPLLLLALIVWLYRKRPEQRVLACHAVAGLALLNHQLLTGLQIENFHWNYLWGPLVTFALVLAAATSLPEKGRGSRRFAAVLFAVAALQAGLGLWLRAQESQRSAEPRRLAEDYRRYLDQRVKSGPRGLAPNSVLAGDKAFLSWAGVVDDQRPLSSYAAALSPGVSNPEWHERVALNAVLLGETRERFEGEQRGFATRMVWGPWSRSPEGRAEFLAARLKAYSRIAREPGPWLTRFAVRYFAQRVGEPTPPAVRRGWRKIQDGPHWRVWERGS